jgi:hypothetical protein
MAARHRLPGYGIVESDPPRGRLWLALMRNQDAIYNLILSYDRTLAVHLRSGRPWLHLDTATWQVTPVRASFHWLFGALGQRRAAVIAIALRARVAQPQFRDGQVAFHN